MGKVLGSNPSTHPSNEREKREGGRESTINQVTRRRKRQKKRNPNQTMENVAMDFAIHFWEFILQN